MTACTLCGRDPVEGGSSIETPDGVVHALCHPEAGPRTAWLSCMEVMCFTMVEHLPGARRPPTPISEALHGRAHAWLNARAPGWKLRGPLAGSTEGT